jgi:uncharacterized membrane-anchored protein
VRVDFLESKTFAVYSYADDGNVAVGETPDYDALLSDRQENAREESKARKAAGLEGGELLGWAEPPHYDEATLKLYWAGRLKFADTPTDTLTYHVRVLGRRGHLVVNGVGDLDQLALVAAHDKVLLAATEFVEGQRYTDFDPAHDKVAAYGIGGLVAGKLALKVGLFAKLGVLLLEFLKPILVGVAILGGILFKVLGARARFTVRR